MTGTNENKQWVLKKKEVREGGQLLLEEQKAFISNAIARKDLIALELAMNSGMDLWVKNENTGLIWFDLAREVVEKNDAFASKALILLSQSSSNVFYEQQNGKELSSVALCSIGCDYSKPLAKFIYIRYLNDLVKFQLNTDLNFFAHLVINLECNLSTIELTQKHGLKFSKESIKSIAQRCNLSLEEENELYKNNDNYISKEVKRLQDEIDKLEIAIPDIAKRTFDTLELHGHLLKELKGKITNEIQAQNLPSREDFERLLDMLDDSTLLGCLKEDQQCTLDGKFE
jgi:hypothetical protein